MPRDHDEAPDPRHARSSSGGLVVVLLALGLLLVLGVIGGGLVLVRKARHGARAVGEEAEVARMEADQALTEANRRRDATVEVLESAEDKRAKMNLTGPGAQLFDGRVLDPIPLNLSRVTIREAERLAGRHLLITFDLLDNDDRRGAYIVYSNAGPEEDADVVERSLYARDRLDKLTGSALGQLSVVRHEPAVGSDGTVFPRYVELRVVLEQ